jgi:hypothetical protein
LGTVTPISIIRSERSAEFAPQLDAAMLAPK